MKIAFAALSLSAPILAVAGLVTFSQPPPQSAEETSTNAVVCLTDANASRFRVRMALNGNDYNCAMLEFGVDENANGVLERNEIDLSLGWDCGEWICRDRRGGNVSCASRPAGRRKLEVQVYLRGDGTPYRVDAKDGEPVFRDVDASALFNPNWNLARLVTRGGTSLESASVKHFPAPFVIILR